MYRTKLERMSPTTIEKLQNDIVASAKTFPQLADEYKMFEDDVKKVAQNMGMYGLFDEDNSIHNKTVKEPKKEKVQHKEKRKSRVYITEDLEQEIVEDLKKYQEDGWKNFTKKKILIKYNLTHPATINKIAEKHGIVFADTSSKVVKAQSTVKALSVSGNNIIGEFDPKDTIVFPTEDIGEELSVRLDNSFTLGGINSYIFENLSIFDGTHFDTIVKKYFERNIKNKKIKTIKLYIRSNMYSYMYMIAMTSITKYCYEYKCNLTLIEGIKSTDIITGYSSQTPNIKAIFDRSYTLAKKTIYRASYEDVKSASTLFYISIIFNNRQNNQCIITDSFDKALDYLTKYEKSMGEVKIEHSLFISSVTEGRITPILKVIKGNI